MNETIRINIDIDDRTFRDVQRSIDNLVSSLESLNVFGRRVLSRAKPLSVEGYRLLVRNCFMALKISFFTLKQQMKQKLQVEKTSKLKLGWY